MNSSGLKVGAIHEFNTEIYSMEKSQTKFQSKVTDEKKSPLQKYQDTVLGKSGIGYLVKFELIMLLCSWIPGALGFLLRKICYASLFAEIGRGVVFGQNVAIRHPHKMKIGTHVIIDDQCVLDAKGCQGTDFVIGDNVILSRGCILSVKEGKLSIGDNTNFGANCLVYAVKEAMIGRDTLLAAQCYIGGSMYHIERTDIPPIQQGSYANGVSIGDGCWLGAGVKVMDGVKIGDGVILGTGAVVNKDIESFTIAVGVPAKVIKKRNA
jgi:acetyltransferase-like isoleucine patch superfamily enzyme